MSGGSTGTVNIREVAQVVRSKNAGPFRLTVDILFKERSVTSGSSGADCSRLRRSRGCTGCRLSE